MNRSIGVVVAVLVAGGLIAAAASPAQAAATAEIKLTVKVSAGGGKAVPVCARIEIPAALKDVAPESISVTMKPPAGGEAVCGQIVLDDKQAELWWILPEATPGETQWTATLSSEPYKGKDVLAFHDTPGEHLDLTRDGRLVTRYMYEFDTSSKPKALETNKPFHHVFDEAGKDPITKGAGGHDTHHRGVFIGWGKVTCGKGRYDFWGMGAGIAQVHKKFLRQTAGPVLARSTDLVDWQDKAGKTIVWEERQVTCFRQPASAILLMEFRTKLKAVAGDVTLDANPEHGGCQFRAHDDVAVNAGATGGKQTADTAPPELKTLYEFHKEGIKTPAQRLNENKDLPWAAICYALRGKRYSVQHMNHKTNPKGTVYSAYRPYGRFGAFFKTEIKSGEVLPLVYRVWAAEGKMPPREEMNLRHAAFDEPPVVEVAK